MIFPGSEAVDAALKLSILHFRSIGQSQRTRFIARKSSYHGSSVAALALGYHARRRGMYKGILAHDGVNFSHVSRAHAYRDQMPGQSEEQYVAELAQELDDEFQAVGPENVCAFVAEPVVGAVGSRFIENARLDANVVGRVLPRPLLLRVISQP